MKINTKTRHDLDILVVEDDEMFRDQVVKLLGGK
jgi:CheY-like chemotaxis protein